MIAWLIIGITLGILSSLHCVTMCGPLMLSLSLSVEQRKDQIFFLLKYHAGRISMYIILGIVAGLVNKAFSLVGMQQIFSVLAGSVTIALVIIENFSKAKRFSNSNAVQKSLLKFIKAKSSSFILGALNGLLPCGMVYMAVAVALSTDNILASALVLLSFGLATLPALLLLGILGIRLSISGRRFFFRVAPFMTCVIGVLLVLRGLNLNIPYISPFFHSLEAIGCRPV